MRISDWSSDVCSSDLDESACRRQRRERAQHLGLLAAHHVGLAGARFVEQAGHDPGLRLALTPVDALEALRDLRRLGRAGNVGNLAPALADADPAAHD